MTGTDTTRSEAEENKKGESAGAEGELEADRNTRQTGTLSNGRCVCRTKVTVPLRGA